MDCEHMNEVNQCEAARLAAKDAVSDAAKMAVRDTFALLGVNIDDPRQVEEFRMDLRFGGEMRSLVGKGKVAIITTAAALLFAALMAGLKIKILG